MPNKESFRFPLALLSSLALAPPHGPGGAAWEALSPRASATEVAEVGFGQGVIGAGIVTASFVDGQRLLCSSPSAFDAVTASFRDLDFSSHASLASKHDYASQLSPSH